MRPARNAGSAAADVSDTVAELVADALRGLRFGQVVIQVHDGVIVQIERTEKVRPPPSKP
jgi:hypothetical protein